MLLIALTLAAPLPPTAGESVWAGQTVFRRTIAARLILPGTAPPQTVSALHIAYRVLRDDGDRLAVRNGGQEVVLLKADAVRARDAVAHFTKLLAAEPNNQTYLAYRGWAHRETLNLPAAVADYDALVAKYPDGSSWWNNRASIKVTAGQYAEAIKDLNKSIELYDSSAVAFRNRGWAKLLSGQPADALPDFDRSAEIGPPAAGTYAFRGLAYAALGRHTEADRDTAEAVKLEPENAAALAARAQVLATSPLKDVRDPKKAVELAESACRNSDWRTGQYLMPLAAAYAAAGRIGDARRALEAALRDQNYSMPHGDAIRKRLKELPAEK